MPVSTYLLATWGVFDRRSRQKARVGRMRHQTFVTARNCAIAERGSDDDGAILPILTLLFLASGRAPNWGPIGRTPGGW